MHTMPLRDRARRNAFQADLMRKRRSEEKASRVAVTDWMLGEGQVEPADFARVFGARLGARLAPLAKSEVPAWNGLLGQSPSWTQESDTFRQRVTELEGENERLQEKIAELEARPPERVEVEKVLYFRVRGDGEQVVYEPRGKGKAVPFSVDSLTAYPRWWLEEVLGQVQMALGHR